MNRVVLSFSALGVLFICFPLFGAVSHPRAGMVRRMRMEGKGAPSLSRFRRIEEVQGFIRNMPNKVLRHEDRFFLVNGEGDRQPLIVVDSAKAKPSGHLFYVGSFRDLQNGKMLRAYIEN